MKHHFYYFGNGNIAAYRLAGSQMESSAAMFALLDSVAAMKFNTVSLMLTDDAQCSPEWLKLFALEAKKRGLVPLIDIDLNWVDEQSELCREHRGWFGKSLKHPFSLLFRYDVPSVRQEAIAYWKSRMAFFIMNGFLGLRADFLHGFCPELRAELYPYIRELVFKYHGVPPIIFEEYILDYAFFAKHASLLQLPNVAAPTYVATFQGSNKQLEAELIFKRTGGERRAQRGGPVSSFLALGLTSDLEESKEDFAKALITDMAVSIFTSSSGWECSEYGGVIMENQHLHPVIADMHQVACQLLPVNSEKFSCETLQLTHYPDLLVFVRRHEPFPGSDIKQRAVTEMVLFNRSLQQSFTLGHEVLHDIACEYQRKMHQQLGWDEAYQTIMHGRVLVNDGITLSDQLEQRVNRTVFRHHPMPQFFKDITYFDALREAEMLAKYGPPLKSLLDTAHSGETSGTQRRLKM